MNYEIALIDDNESSSDGYRIMAKCCNPKVAELVYEFYRKNEYSKGYRLQLSEKTTNFKPLKGEDIPWP